jgi:hypothetical protein
LRPDQPLLASLKEAFRQGLRSAASNWLPMVALLAAMAAVVLTYYIWPTGAAILSAYGKWQRAGGLLRAGLAAGFAGGILSELSLILLRDKGRFSLVHLENMGFRFCVFFLTGITSSTFYDWQAVWFGDGASWRNIVPKIFVDQLGYTVFWSTPVQTITFRWQVLRFSLSRLRAEFGLAFVVDRMLPVLVTNWLFWIPGVTLVLRDATAPANAAGDFRDRAVEYSPGRRGQADRRA